MPGEMVEPISSILLAEDNEDDVVITERALKKGKIQNKLYVVRDGEEAVQFLRQEGTYKDAPRLQLSFWI